MAPSHQPGLHSKPATSSKESAASTDSSSLVSTKPIPRCRANFGMMSFYIILSVIGACHVSITASKQATSRPACESIPSCRGRAQQHAGFTKTDHADEE